MLTWQTRGICIAVLILTDLLCRHIARTVCESHRSHVIISAAHQLGCDAVLDFGAGVGRLAQCLAMQHGLRVCGVDCSAEFRIKAEKRSVSNLHPLLPPLLRSYTYLPCWLAGWLAG